MWDMLVVLCIRILEAMFAIGILGSILVILISGVEDVETMFDTTDDSSAH
jgi:hypothetical protein